MNNKSKFSKILIANRGEIALRVIRACKELGIECVAVYSEADVNSLHVRQAHEKVCIGPPISSQSYLNIEAIIKAAKDTGAEAVHPGYGYLAESEQFALKCNEEGLVFIGPTPNNLRMAGDKITAKKVISEAGVPIIPSSPGGINTEEEALEICSKIGYPVMIKASGGGGGRGIRICENEEMLLEEFSIAKMEARASFGNEEVYIEKCIVEPRHIEFQILADGYSNIIHLGERECTIQRRYQKLIEESPSPGITPELRRSMGEAAIAAARAVDYLNAGTVEFLLDRDGNFYFMEINARIQVEHPVTELITGIDLVKEQIGISSGKRLDYSYEDLICRGWAIECRINAEDPDRNFIPSPGRVEEYSPPGGFGIRLDTYLYQGFELPVYYDSLIAKLISFSSTREDAIAVMKRALGEFHIAPLKTTIPLYLQIMDDPLFREGRFSTDFIKRFVPDEDDDDDDE
ncbi:MAG: acetyl-CoA carboxylase biotin carboxylase subunit [Spirochaetota bacterium]|nr:acetyl-CoA carboxylase biotin carboxylase subunit [Spirochaetota bacterium]